MHALLEDVSVSSQTTVKAAPLSPPLLPHPGMFQFLDSLFDPLDRKLNHQHWALLCTFLKHACFWSQVLGRQDRRGQSSKVCKPSWDLISEVREEDELFREPCGLLLLLAPKQTSWTAGAKAQGTEKVETIKMRPPSNSV